MDRRQPFRYAPERPTTGKVRVARDSGTIAEVAGMVVNVMLSSFAEAETYPLHKRLDQEP
jgi:hypothetical protein